MAEISKFNFIPENEDPNNKLTVIVQVGCVVRDLDKTMKEMKRVFGVEPDRAGMAQHVNVKYRGQDADYEAKMAFYGFANVELEFVQPVRGNSIWADHLKNNETILHHIRFNVRDYEGVVQDMKDKRIEIYQCGALAPDPAWKFAYFDTEPVLGFVLEILGRSPSDE